MSTLVELLAARPEQTRLASTRTDEFIDELSDRTGSVRPPGDGTSPDRTDAVLEELLATGATNWSALGAPNTASQSCRVSFQQARRGAGPIGNAAALIFADNAEARLHMTSRAKPGEPAEAFLVTATADSPNGRPTTPCSRAL